MKNTILTALALLVAPLLALQSPPAHAAVAEVVDNAGFFSADAVRQANQKLDDLDAQHHKQMRVETYAQIPADQRNGYTDANQRQFFQRWTVRRAEQAGVNGVMVLICREPAQIQVEIGKRTAASGVFTQADRVRMVKALGDAFKAKNYDDGLNRAAEIFASAISSRSNSSGQAAEAPATAASIPTPAGTPNPPAASPPPPYQFPSAPSPTVGRSGGSFGWLWIIFLIVGFFIVLRIIRGLFGGGRRTYPSNYGQSYGTNYPPNSGYGGGGGFGRGFGGGILGGLLGSWVGNQMYRHGDSSSSSSSSSPPPSSSGGGGFNEPSQSDFSSGSSGDASSGGTDFGSSSNSSSSSGGDFSGGSSGDANSGGTSF